MNRFIEYVINENGSDARTVLEDRIHEILDEKLNQIREKIYNEMNERFGITESNITKMGRTKLVRVRIRGGKIQRRKKLSAVKGYTTRGGKLIRMSPGERRHRQMAAKRSKFKRRAKLKQALRKRRMSLRKRSAMGI